VWLVQRSQHLLFGIRPTGYCPGHRFWAVLAHRERTVLLQHLEEVVAAIASINGGYPEHARAARALAEDGPIAAAFGVDRRRLSLLLSGLSAAYAAVAGLFIALSHTLAPSQIYAWMGVVFAAVIIGRLGNAFGLLAASIAIAASEALTMAVTSPGWAPLVSFMLLIVVLLLRPEL
jgi:hypothetical protein